MLDRVHVSELALFWHGRANALRQLDKASRYGNEHATATADAYEECAKELTAAIAYDIATGTLPDLAKE